MPLGLEKGIVMTMSRNAGSMKNDKKFNMREIVIDTTGLDPLNGDRIVEIGTRWSTRFGTIKAHRAS
jgi:hypothetical protein